MPDKEVELKPFIVACIHWNDFEQWLCDRDAEGYEIVHLGAEMYQGESIFNVVMKNTRKESV